MSGDLWTSLQDASVLENVIKKLCEMHTVHDSRQLPMFLPREGGGLGLFLQAVFD